VGAVVPTFVAVAVVTEDVVAAAAAAVVVTAFTIVEFMTAEEKSRFRELKQIHYGV
jgi:hypothetical protein